MNEKFRRWLDGEYDLLENAGDTDEKPYSSREEIKEGIRKINRKAGETDRSLRVARAERKGFYILYSITAVVSCILLTGVLLFTIANLPRYGEENRRTTEVVERYVTKGVEETGAVNIVAGMILDRKSTRLNSSHPTTSRMPSSA